MLRLSILPVGLSALISIITSPSAHANPYGYQQRYQPQATAYMQRAAYPAQPRYVAQPNYGVRRPVQQFEPYQQPYYQEVAYQPEYPAEIVPPAQYAPQPRRFLPFQQSAQYAEPLATERIIMQAPQQRPLPAERRAILDRAHQVLGVRYKYGGNSVREGLDCSALIQLTHKPLGRSIPRTAAEQSRASRTISRQELRPGDLIFFNTLGKGVSHVGIYVKNGNFIHAASGGGRVMVDNLSKSYWQKRIVKYGTFVG